MLLDTIVYRRVNMEKVAGAIVFIIGLIVISAWVYLPFAVMGIESKLDKIIKLLEKQ